MSYHKSRTQQGEEKACFSFQTKIYPMRDFRTQPMESHGLLGYYGLPNFLSTLKKEFSPFFHGSCTQLAMVSDPKLQFFADPE